MKKKSLIRQASLYKKHKRERNSFLCVTRSGAYYHAYVGANAIYFVRIGGVFRDFDISRPIYSEQTAKETCGLNKHDRMIVGSDIQILKYREKDQWVWYGPISGILTICTPLGKHIFGILVGVPLQEIKDLFGKFPNCDIDDGTKKQNALETERVFASRRNAKTYKKVYWIYTITWLIGMALSAVHLWGTYQISRMLVIPVAIFPSIMLYEYIRFSDYMDSNYDRRSHPHRKVINPMLPLWVINLMILLRVKTIALLSWGNILLLSVPVIVLWMYFLIRYSSDYMRNKVQTIILLLLLLLFYIPSSFIALNIFLDTSAVKVYRAEVLYKYTGKSRGDLRVRLPDGREETLGAWYNLYRRVIPGDHVLVYQRNGALDCPYLYIAG